MRTITSLNHVTLDGIIQSGGSLHEDASGGFTQGGWTIPFRSEDAGKAVLDLMSHDFDLLLGRRTYEIWAVFWPSSHHPVANAINKAAKYIVTKSVGSLDWANSHPLRGDVVDEVRRLKASGGPDLHIWGSSQLLQTLIAAQLVDEFRVFVYPVVLGKGKRLFEAGVPPFGLTLVESRSTSKGVLINTYRPAGPLPDMSAQPDNPSEAELARRKKVVAEDTAAKSQNWRTVESACMANTKTLIAQAYSAFNRRDIDSALALMSEEISWPKASEGGRVIGKEAIRAYWTRQWAEFDPHVEPIEVIDNEAGRTEVKVHQLVKNLNGDILSDQTLFHVYTIANGLIDRMDIGESKPAFGQEHAG